MTVNRREFISSSVMALGAGMVGNLSVTEGQKTSSRLKNIENILRNEKEGHAIFYVGTWGHSMFYGGNLDQWTMIRLFKIKLGCTSGTFDEQVCYYDIFDKMCEKVFFGIGFNPWATNFPGVTKRTDSNGVAIVSHALNRVGTSICKRHSGIFMHGQQEIDVGSAALILENALLAAENSLTKA